MRLFAKLIHEESGQDLAEYGIALAVIAAGVGVIALAIATNVTTLWTTARDNIAAAV